jgi:hypothetical protein
MFIADAGVSGNHSVSLGPVQNGLRGTVCAGAMISTAEMTATSRVFSFQSAIRVRTALKPSEGVSAAVPSNVANSPFAVP